jgi:hypothetical protein
MHRFRYFLATIALLVVLLAPAFSYALVPIGGKVVGPPIPCKAGGGYIVTVVGLGIGSGVFWYSPLSRPFLYGPPLPGKWVLGLSDVPAPCGLRVNLIGTSLGI